jgi:hypothetical protein
LGFALSSQNGRSPAPRPSLFRSVTPHERVVMLWFADNLANIILALTFLAPPYPFSNPYPQSLIFVLILIILILILILRDESCDHSAGELTES